MNHIAKTKALNFLLLLTSLIGYLEWGQDQKQFLFQIESDLFSKALADPLSVMHPFIILPLLGQVLLMITLFQKAPNKRLTYIGITSIGVLLSFIFIIGCISLNLRIMISSLPFFDVKRYQYLAYEKGEE